VYSRVVTISPNKIKLILELENSMWGLSLVEANLVKKFLCFVHIYLSALYFN